MERARKGKKPSRAYRVSTSDPEATIAKMKDGGAHAFDLDTGAVVAAEPYPADEGDTTPRSPSARSGAPLAVAVAENQQPPTSSSAHQMRLCY